MPIDFEDPLAKTRVTRNVLMLCDVWSEWTSGIARINHVLANKLAEFPDIQVYSTLLVLRSIAHHEDEWSESAQNPVRLIRLSRSTDDSGDRDDEFTARDLYTALNNAPAGLLEGSADEIPKHVSVIVGHVPVTAQGALHLRDTLYPDSKVVLFYHTIPDEVKWLGRRTWNRFQELEDLIRYAESADVVYSVSQKVHRYFTARFARCGARVDIDHRLMLPQSAPQSYHVDLNPIHVNCAPNSPCYRLVTMCRGAGYEEWAGLDIAVCAVGKVAAILRSRAEKSGAPEPSVILTVINVHPSQANDVREKLHKDIVAAKCNGAKVVVMEMRGPEVGANRQLAELRDRSHDLCILPARTELTGYIGTTTICGGLPTLLPESAAMADLIRRLSCSPEHYLVKMTGEMAAYRQDAAVWAQRIISILDNPQLAKSRAQLLKTALQTDEMLRDTHDNFITYCLGGIHVRFELTDFQYIDPTVNDGARQLETRRRFDKFLLSAVRQSWRFRRYPLQATEQIGPLIDNIKGLPAEDLAEHVIDVIEDRDRRIVGIDCDSGSVVVYCPDVDSLRDLWAMCDQINFALFDFLFPRGQTFADNPILADLGLRMASTRVIISGPEYLQYKEQLVAHRQLLGL